MFRGDQALERLLSTIQPGAHVLDVGSGIGAHADMIRKAGRSVTTISLSPPADYVGDFLLWRSMKNDFDAIWACHVLEHQVDPGAFLRACRSRLRDGGVLAVTVPPLKHAVVGGHVTLWNAGLLLYHLILAGFDCRNARVGSYGYNISIIVERTADIALPELAGDGGDVALLAPWFPCTVWEGFDGRLPNINWDKNANTEPAAPPEDAPEHVAILGLGPSLESYVDIVKRFGNRRRFADEVWAINAVADVIQCDRVFHLDDVRIQEIRAAAKPQSNIAAMLDWLKRHPGPVYTSRPHQDYPGLVAFPLQDVINNLGYGYFNSTAAYAVAYAIHIGVKRISLFGLDFSYENSHQAEKGRGCVEYWLGYARARGIEICVSAMSSLMDGNVPKCEQLYGYDTVDVEIDANDDDDVIVLFKPKATLPTAAEIEARYDHSKPTVSPELLQRA
jgi:SAM-dependent methyltransferase